MLNYAANYTTVADGSGANATSIESGNSVLIFGMAFAVSANGVNGTVVLQDGAGNALGHTITVNGATQGAVTMNTPWLAKDGLRLLTNGVNGIVFHSNAGA